MRGGQLLRRRFDQKPDEDEGSGVFDLTIAWSSARGFSDRDIRSPRPHRPPSTVASPCLPHRPSPSPHHTRLSAIPDTRWPVRRWSQGLVNQSLLRLVGGRRKPTAIAACLVWHRRHRSLHGGRSGRASSYLPARHAQEGRDRRWNGLDGPVSRASGLRPSLPGVHLRVSRTAVPARTAASVVPALATRAHAGPPAGLLAECDPFGGGTPCCPGLRCLQGLNFPSASASRKAPTGSLRVGR